MNNIEIMKLLRQHGVSDADIAAAFGISRQRVHQKLGPAPAEVPKPAPAPLLHPDKQKQPLSAVLADWRARQGMTQEEAAAAFHMSVWTLRRWEQGYACNHEYWIRLALYLLDKQAK